MQPTLNNKMTTIKPIISQNILLNFIIYTHQGVIYKNPSKDYNHKTINHAIGEICKSRFLYKYYRGFVF